MENLEHHMVDIHSGPGGFVRGYQTFSMGNGGSVRVGDMDVWSTGR